ncbi:MAG TPA: DHA2 family efflux MFS transporter permease subunit [Vicinamibacterales bacterium]|nr:DHA2 family efflux MFS transporter permease subunit [Vicinamibacterales bacterium]
MPDGSDAERGAAPSAPGQPWAPRANPWVIAVVVALAAFMEVLDTSIANVALPYIAGNLGASNDESTWVLTSYLVSNAIVLPITGWFAGLFGRKRFFMVCLSIFTFSSLLCGIAPSLAGMILFRVLQGAGGGGLQPMAQAILADTFPAEKRGLAFALFGITTIIAPTIGPTLGGWITDNYSWRWIFFINLPVGIAALLLIRRLLEDPPWIKGAARAGVAIDYVGIALLVTGVGALQILLDRGQELDWFGSPFIVSLAAVAALGLISLVVWEWFHETPIVDVRLYKNVNFLGANFMMFILGIMLFSSLVMMPQFLQTLMGYSAESAGLVLSGGGVLLLFLMPIAGTLSSKVQARYIIAFGWLALSAAMFYSARTLSLEISFRAAAFLRVVQVFGLGFLFVPINLVSYIGMPPEKSGSVAGLVNFMRNIGASIGTSMVTTVIARRAQFRQVQLAAHAGLGQLPFVTAAEALTRRLVSSGLDASRATAASYARLYRALIGQATALAYIDAFWLLCTIAAIMFVLSFGLKKNEPGAGGQVALE